MNDRAGPLPFASETVAAHAWETVQSLIREGRLVEALPILTRFIENGYAGVETDLACLHECLAVDGDRTTAVDWHRRALAACEDDQARFDYATQILTWHQEIQRFPSPEPVEQAIRLLRDLAERRIGRAAVYLAGAYLADLGLPKDVAAGEAMAEIAAEQGYALGYLVLRFSAILKKQRFRAFYFKCKLALHVSRIARRNMKDERLLGVSEFVRFKGMGPD